MTRILHLDPFSGASGDMTLGLLLDLGLPLSLLRDEIGKLGLPDVTLEGRKVVRGGLAATQCEVRVPDGERSRRLADVRAILAGSGLAPGVRARATRVFDALFAAESRVHGVPVEEVHLHEAGALDAIVDIAGSVAGLSALGIDRVTCSPVNLGAGWIESAHGTSPAPSPAAADLLRGAPVFSAGPAAERTTPTGAALLSVLVSSFGPVPAMRLVAVGCGAGTRNDPGWPNLLRGLLGEEEEPPVLQRADVVALQAVLDDCSPERLGRFLDLALRTGAIDAWLTPVTMKKSRPGVEATVLADPALADRLATLLFEETTTLGCRILPLRRITCEREIVNVAVPGGTVRVKVARHHGRIVSRKAEHGDLSRIAELRGVSLRIVEEEVLRSLPQESD